jgi:hypothetical protein
LSFVVSGASVGGVIGTDEIIRQGALRDSDLGEESGRHQRMVAVLVESHDLKVDPDPILTQAERDKLAELESILYKI